MRLVSTYADVARKPSQNQKLVDDKHLYLSIFAEISLMPSILENLPNELLLLIFNHLSAIDLLYAFTCLNRRFSSLIPTIQNLHLDFSGGYLSKTQFATIIRQLRALPVHAVRVSNRDYVDGASLFISYVSPNQLSHLHSLTLIDVERATIEKYLHRYPRLTSLAIEATAWRSLPRRLLPPLPNLTHCRLPILELFHGSQERLVQLSLEHCTSENLKELTTLVPHLRSLRLVLNTNTIIPPIFTFPTGLISLTLTLRSILFNEFERLIRLTGHLKQLTVTFSNSEHDPYCFDEYLSGEHWFSLRSCVDQLQFNVTVHKTHGRFSTTDLLSHYQWFERDIHCQSIEETNGYHLYSLPYIDDVYTLNANWNSQHRIRPTDFDRVRHLYLINSNATTDDATNDSLPYLYRRLERLTVVSSCLNDITWSFTQTLLINSRLQILELRLTSISDASRDYFNQFLHSLPASVRTLILNAISSQCLTELLEANCPCISNVKRLRCAVQDREQFETLLLLLMDRLQDESLIYLNISVEKFTQSSNLLSGWLSKTDCLRRARVTCSDRQCSIWI